MDSHRPQRAGQPAPKHERDDHGVEPQASRTERYAGPERRKLDWPFPGLHRRRAGDAKLEGG